MRVRMFGLSHTGRVRKNNQDSYFFDETLGVAIVADGIGGRKGGEVASGLVVHGLREAFIESDTLRHGEMGNFLMATIDKLNAKIIERGRRDPRIEGMGTTVECLAVEGERLIIAHVGDSRTYLHVNKHMFQLTIDHNVKTFVKRGWIPEESLGPGTRTGALVRGLGLVHEIEVDIYEVPLKVGQVFLACSDGLYDMVVDRDIAKLIREGRGNLKTLPKSLVDAANRHGGNDNVTVVLVAIEAD